MSVYKRGNTWWYKFWFAGQEIRESAKTHSKTLAKMAEKRRHRECEEGFNNLSTKERFGRVRKLGEVADEYLRDYEVRHRSLRFMKYAVRHLKRLVGHLLLVDFSEDTIKAYQSARLTEGAAPKTVNEEVGVLLRLLGDPGEAIRAKMRRRKTLKLAVSNNIGKAFSDEEKEALLEATRVSRSPHISTALVLSLNTAVRDSEIRNFMWSQVNLLKGYVVVGRSKSSAGEGRPIPLNSVALEALIAHAKWYVETFGETRPEWYLFPFGRRGSLDPSRPVTTLKTAWANVKERAGVTGRWHDVRHTVITELAETGAGDQEIMDIAGHVSRQMLNRYSHVRMEAKRRALQAIVDKSRV